MAEPTVGQIVHFYPPATERENAEFYAAIVTAVAGEVVHLVTFGPRSLYFHEAVLPMSANRDPDDGGWCWPPRA